MTWMLKAGGAGCLVLGLLGCSSPENKYYTLSAADPAAPANAVRTGGRTISIDEISVPAYLDRPQIVVKKDSNTADIREYERWVEPLDGMIRRSLSADLAARLGPGRVLDKPNKDSYLLSVTIEQFGQEGDQAVLHGQWTLKPQQKDGPPALAHSFVHDRPVTGKEMPDAVSTMSGLLGALSDDISGSVGN